MRRGLMPFEGGNTPLRRPFEDIFRMLDDSFEGLTTRTNVDVYEEDNTVVVKADLPGFTKDDIKVDVHEDNILLQAQRTVDENEKGKYYYRRERGLEQLKELINLPTEVDKDNASARMENGVLEVRLPKVEGLKDAKRIEIE